MTPTQKQSEQLQTLMQSGQISWSLSFSGTMTKEDEEMSKSALSTSRAKEDDFEKKLEMRERKFIFSSDGSKKKPDD
ncbi:transcriptional activator [Actinidia rufa]|uniref:Transcriptional activator n=1 Tax=Actinidia rufa TaxID=165716 RepID=A0A7J0GD81_9ERIC|nr:transcriptional activator [Actinidia rufa]